MRIAFLLFILMVSFFAGNAQASSVCMKNTCVQVEVVTTPVDMMRGLQGRDRLEDDHGMLFVFEKEDLYRFWMKDMKFSIDIIWLDHQGKIITITPSRPACMKESCDVYVPSGKAMYVLEVQSGYALKHHFKTGDFLQLNLALPKKADL